MSISVKAPNSLKFVPVKTCWRTINWRYQLGTLAGVEGVPTEQQRLRVLSSEYTDEERDLANHYFKVMLSSVRRARARYALMLRERYSLAESSEDIVQCLSMFERSTAVASALEDDDTAIFEVAKPEVPESKNTTLASNPELVALIAKDVIRTHAARVLFKSVATRVVLHRVLLVWALEHPDTSYKQGMNEILAQLLLAYHKDRVALAEVELTEELLEILDDKHMEADLYTLFDGVMAILHPYYVAGANNTVEGNQTPLAFYMDKIHNKLLPLIDPKLSQHLAEGFVMPQLYLLKWLRLLFVREMTTDQSLELWDYIFECFGLSSSESHSREAIEYVAIALLTRISKLVLEHEPAFCLGTILKYPHIDNISEVIETARTLQNATGVESDRKQEELIENPVNVKKSTLFKYFEKIPNDPELQYVYPVFSKRLDLSSAETVSVTLPEIMSGSTQNKHLIEARGYLVKMGDGVFAKDSYKRRYFVLSGFVLRYYKNRHAVSTMREGFIDLRDRVVSAGESDKFEIVLAPKEEGRKSLFARRKRPSVVHANPADKHADDALLKSLALSESDSLDPYRTYHIFAADHKAWLQWLGVLQFVVSQPQKD